MASFIVYGDASGQVTVAAPAVAGSNTITFPAETGTLYTTASTTPIAGQIAWDTTVKTSGFTAVAYGGYFCNTTGGAFTVTLPATPTRGQFVVIVDYAGTAATNNITVSGNGANIKGTSGNATLKTNRQGITFTYIDSTQGWVASSNVYGGSTPFTQPYTASYVVVAGAGAGGNNSGGGGGAGGYQAGTLSLTPTTVYTVTVGAGGTGVAPSGGYPPINGSNSVFSSVTSTGGGGGANGGPPGGGASTQAGGSGGSGGGGTNVGSGTNAGSGTPGQGNNGGNGSKAPSFEATGGGGGSGSIGVAGTPGQGGNGGSGTSTSITGTPATYAGGGGGGGDTTVAVGTGQAGGGNGAPRGTPGNNATANTGSGGGGGGGAFASGSNGGSGIVIISVPTSSYPGVYTGTATTGTNGSNTWIKWTSSGTYTA